MIFQSDAKFYFPKTVPTIEGDTLNVEELASKYNLILLTLKAPGCPICPHLLILLNFLGLNSASTEGTLEDPFERTRICTSKEDLKFNRTLLCTDSYFLVLCPGSVSQLVELRDNTNFSKHSFILDTELTLSRSIGLCMATSHIWPAILHIQPYTLKISPIKFGREAGFYGHHSLISFLSATRFEAEVRSLRTIYHADKMLDRLGKLVERTPVFVTKSFILPIEILDRMFKYLDFATLQKTMNISRQWQMLGLRALKNELRNSIESLKELLPKLEDGEVAMSIHNDSWKCYYRPPVPVSVLNQRLSKLIIVLSNAQSATNSA